MGTFLLYIIIMTEKILMALMNAPIYLYLNSLVSALSSEILE